MKDFQHNVPSYIIIIILKYAFDKKTWVYKINLKVSDKVDYFKTH